MSVGSFDHSEVAISFNFVLNEYECNVVYQMSLVDRRMRFSKCCFFWRGGSALRVTPAETRLTVYRRLKVFDTLN